MHRLSGRRTTSLVLAAVVLAGCGSRAAPDAGPSSLTTGPTTTPTSSATPSSVPASDVPAVLFDSSTGNYLFTVATRRTFGVGVYGVGVAWPAGDLPASAFRHTGAGTLVHFQGPAFLDRKAHLLRDAPVLFQIPSSSEPTRLVVRARLGGDGSGVADVWLAGRHYHLTEHAVPRSPVALDTALDQVISAYRSNDWIGLYRVTVAIPGLDQAGFVREYRSGHVAISQFRVIGQVRYRSSAGVHYADVPVHLTGTIAGQHPPRELTLEFVQRGSGWLYSTLK
jgi:hypothetical protein